MLQSHSSLFKKPSSQSINCPATQSGEWHLGVGKKWQNSIGEIVEEEFSSRLLGDTIGSCKK